MLGESRGFSDSYRAGKVHLQTIEWSVSRRCMRVFVASRLPLPPSRPFLGGFVFSSPISFLDDRVHRVFRDDGSRFSPIDRHNAGLDAPVSEVTGVAKGRTGGRGLDKLLLLPWDRPVYFERMEDCAWTYRPAYTRGKAAKKQKKRKEKKMLRN